MAKYQAGDYVKVDFAGEGPQGSPRTDKLIEASILWAERIMAKIDEENSTFSSMPWGQEPPPTSPFSFPVGWPSL